MGEGIPPINRGTLGYIARHIRGQHSEFFRTDIFYHTRDILLREIALHKRKTSAPLKVAVIGCAAGEEVFSLAMAFHHQGQLGNLSLRAIDHDKAMIVAAARGRFCFDDYEGRIDFFDAISVECRSYFLSVPGQPDYFLIDPRIKRAITFQCADALQSDFAGKFPLQDMIIINNVLVHMKEEDKTRVIENLAKSVVPGGKIIVNESVDFSALRFVSKEGTLYLYEKT
jgi:chemotaxis methyl-accepting protein methylase